MPSARHMASDGVDRANHLAEPHATLHIAHPLQRLLPFGEAPDILGGGLERSAKLRSDLPPRIVDIRLTYAECLPSDGIEFSSVAKNSCIAALSYIVDDLRGGLLHARQVERTSICQTLEHCGASFAGDEFHLFARSHHDFVQRILDNAPGIRVLQLRQYIA